MEERTSYLYMQEQNEVTDHFTMLVKNKQFLGYIIDQLIYLKSWLLSLG